MRVGVDIGGTFTDLMLWDENGRAWIGKVLTTADPSAGVEEVLRQTLAKLQRQANSIRHLVHGTTLVTNAIIERKGASTALITSAGFRDSIEIGREHRYELYDLDLEHPKPLVHRHLRFSVPERTWADGTQDVELDEEHIARLVRELSDAGIEAVAVCFLHSYANPDSEARARAVIEDTVPGLQVSLSSEVVPEIGEFERASTTIANVYVRPLVESYLNGLRSRLEQIGFEGRLFIMLSSGGVATFDTCVRYPIRLLESGPAAGALAAASVGQDLGRNSLLSFDMGGTTAKLCVVDDGEPLVTHDFEVDRRYRFKKGSGLPVRVPVIEMIEIGAGGGSIARIDSLGLLKVGPESAGADPGPVCYARGGRAPTVTDADLVLGYLDPDYFLGGEMKLDVAAAEAALAESIGDGLGMSVPEAAWGVHQVVNEAMANAARVHVVERGRNPRGLPVVAFGGAGPVHGYGVAELLGCPELVLPYGAGVASAQGLLVAPLAFDFVRSYYGRLDQMDWDEVNRIFEAMEGKGTALLADSGAGPEQINHTRTADIRYVGQGHTIRVPIPDGILSDLRRQAIYEEFDRVYRHLYGREGPPVGLEALTWRVVSRGPRPGRAATPHPGEGSAGNAEAARKGERPAFFGSGGGYVLTPVYDRYRLVPGSSLTGPAIIEERESTAVIGKGGRVRVDERLNIVVTLGGGT
ncbi:MAG: hydantoinase/oxoprolinase family protein [Acidimicrobiia bacterium]|nr:hydantoinase/oxoprolinase family protein [bacterium]MYD04050.1 hydantoinase/oxoprolinase family protein [Acidimicrobiia bacterium]